MESNLDSNLQPMDHPASSQPTRSGGTRLVRISFLTFLGGFAGFILAVVLAIAGLRSGAFMFYVDETMGTLSFVCGAGGVLSWLTSLITGLIVIGRRRIVLWWLLPMMLLVCIGIILAAGG